MDKPQQIPPGPPVSGAAATTVTAPAQVTLQINGKPYFHDGDPELPLLWYLRDTLQLTGTKYACGTGACGACTVLLDDKPANACMTTMKSADGRRVTTIEGLETDRLHPVQRAWIDEDVMQCGYCQAGQILGVVDLLRRKPQPTEQDIARIGNLCRCGTYPDIRRAIMRAVELIKADSGKPDSSKTDKSR